MPSAQSWATTIVTSYASSSGESLVGARAEHDHDPVAVGEGLDRAHQPVVDQRLGPPHPGAGAGREQEAERAHSR